MWILRVIIILVVVGGVVAGVSAELSNDHSISIEGSMDIPDRTVETEWGEATISEIGKEQRGDSLDVSTNAPTNDSYVLSIVNSQETILRSEGGTGDVDKTFGLTGTAGEPGTYVVAMTKDGGDEAEAVEPFIVEGYDVEQQATDISKGEELTVSVTLTKIESRVESPQVVNVTLTGNNELRAVEAAKIDELQYEATFETGSLSTGNYEVFTGVEGSDSIYGVDELIGLSSAEDVEIQEQAEETQTESPTPTEEGGGGAGGGVGVSGSATPESVETGQSASPEETTGTDTDVDGVTSTGRESTEDGATSTSAVSDENPPEATTAYTSEGMETTITGTPATTSTGTPVIPNLTLLILLISIILIGYRAQK